MPTKNNFISILIMGIAITILNIGFAAARSPQIRAGYLAPNLRPHEPAGWTEPVVPASEPGTSTATPLFAGLSSLTYFDWAVVNTGNAAAIGTSYTCLYLDGTLINSWPTTDLPADSSYTQQDWTYAVPAPGVHTLILEADCTNVINESDESDNMWEAQFTWQPYFGVIVSDQQGFDKCNIATLPQLETWWLNSPYKEVNIYIGGSSRGCSNTGLNASWVKTASNQGWNFIPTWVGPQAPCTSYSSRFSWNVNTAYEQGRNDADAATSAAANLGLISPNSQTIIYYDLEAFSNNTACRDAAKSFISGWVSRLQELGHRAGVYGSGCGSYVSDWATIANVPDDVWLAHWVYSSYDPNANVWNVSCVSNTLWANQQRLRQYAGGHNETWGNVTLNIDSNVADGHVAGNHDRQQLAPLETQPDSALQIQDIHLLTPTQGWAIIDQQLLRTEDGGQQWADITPSRATPVMAGFFLNPDHGWVVTPDPAGGGDSIEILHTPDGGKTWRGFPVSISTPDGSNQIETASLHFVNPQTGWLALKLSSGSNFSLGMLFQTLDGGKTWTQLSLPIGAPVRFANANAGWTAGGPAGNELYVTRNGGRTWNALDLVSPQWDKAGALFYDLPTFTEGLTGVLPVTVADPARQRVEFYVTHDGGRSWELEAAIPVPTNIPVGAKVPVSVLDTRTWILANPETGTLYFTSDGGETVSQLDSGLPGIVKVDFAAANFGWAQTVFGTCSGSKDGWQEQPFRCMLQTGLLRTTDGGLTWAAMFP
ncbi:MAG: glycoside hydrolase domain-containing protein [Anaerolineales bacterium]